MTIVHEPVGIEGNVFKLLAGVVYNYLKLIKQWNVWLNIPLGRCSVQHTCGETRGLTRMTTFRSVIL